MPDGSRGETPRRHARAHSLGMDADRMTRKVIRTWLLRSQVRMPRRGLEPPRAFLCPLVPQTSASASSATWAVTGATVYPGAARRVPGPEPRGRGTYDPRPMAADRLRITEIFHSIQGESTWAGCPCVFVRLTGCHLRCGYCDTGYAFHEGGWKGLDDLVEEVCAFDCG